MKILSYFIGAPDKPLTKTHAIWVRCEPNIEMPIIYLKKAKRLKQSDFEAILKTLNATIPSSLD